MCINRNLINHKQTYQPQKQRTHTHSCRSSDHMSSDTARVARLTYGNKQVSNIRGKHVLHRHHTHTHPHRLPIERPNAGNLCSRCRDSISFFWKQKKRTRQVKNEQQKTKKERNLFFFASLYTVLRVMPMVSFSIVYFSVNGLQFKSPTPCHQP